MEDVGAIQLGNGSSSSSDGTAVVHHKLSHASSTKPGLATSFSVFVPIDSITESIEHTSFSHQHLNCNQHVNIEFEKLTMRVRNDSEGGGKWRSFGRSTAKTILNGVSGTFRAGQFTAIMGPSGAGKTTLMNILAGHGHNYAGGDIGGTVRINGIPRDFSKFRKTACYIMQQDQPMPNLSVREVMQFVAVLKLPLNRKRTLKQRQTRIDNVIDTLGLRDSLDTHTQNLSGGQRKRLVIAQELINNPPVMLLDEPTSGLDSAACLQCIAIMKKLALGGRTIICSIHQPSTRLIEMFDQIYVLSPANGGQCIYRGGGVGQMVAYFERHGFPCPPYHNPTDFVTEIANGQFGSEVVQKFVDLIVVVDNNVSAKRRSAEDDKAQFSENRKQHVGGMLPLTLVDDDRVELSQSMQIQDRELGCATLTQWRVPEVSVMSERGGIGKNNPIDNSTNNDTYTSTQNNDEIFHSEEMTFMPPPLDGHTQRIRYPTRSWKQFKVLTRRTFTSIHRDATLMRLQLAAHVVIGLIMGLLYYDIGNESSKLLSNAALVFFSMLFVMFAGLMTTIITFPLEVSCVLREHLNYWYSLKIYCLAKLVVDISFQCVFPLIYGCIVYWLSGQPSDLFRMAMFLLCLVATSLVAQSLGFFIGATITSVKDAGFLGPITAIPLLLFSGFFINLREIPWYMQWITHISYLRYSFEAAMFALYGYDRANLNCNKNALDSYSFCFWQSGKDFLVYMKMENVRFWIDMVVMLGFFVVFRVGAYFALTLRLRRTKINTGKG